MLQQTWAIFVDAYRELNAKKLFWIVLGLSGLVVGIFAAIGINEEGVSFLWWPLSFIPNINSETYPPELLYKQLFFGLGIGIWLTWIATILALVSTASIFPDFIQSGSIEMMLSKPISRARLFLTKYLASLLFVALQVFVFTGASFLVIGIRGGTWEPGLFLAVPIIVIFFSYLFSVCVLLGLLTRSTIASLLLTILFWFVLFLLNAADGTLVMFDTRFELQATQIQQRIERAETNTARLVISQKRDAGEEVSDSYEPTRAELEETNPILAKLTSDLDEAQSNKEKLRKWVRLSYLVRTPLPKTNETISLLERALISVADLETAARASGSDMSEFEDESSEDVGRVDDEAVSLELQKKYRERSAWWVMGTSLLFEGFILLICLWRFGRRDF